MSNYSSQIQTHVYNNLGEIEDQLGEVTTSDVQSEVRRTLEENDFYAPEFCYNSELLEIIVDHDLEMTFVSMGLRARWKRSSVRPKLSWTPRTMRT